MLDVNLVKDKDVNLVAKNLKDFTSEVVSPTQVYNHLRKWRQRWGKVSKLKDLSGALWDNDLHAIMLDVEHYQNHIKVVLIATFLNVFFWVGSFLVVTCL
jgi:methionine salvage enolase-phosphatase E1